MSVLTAVSTPLFDGLPFSTPALGAGALLSIVILLILTGKLVPRRTYDDKVHEAAEWRTECRIKDQQIAERDEQIRTMAELGKTVDAIMRALQRGASDHEVPR